MTALPRTERKRAGTARRWLALAGILAPVVFTASVLAQSLTREDHSLLKDPGSALAAGPAGWIQDATFAVTGLLMIAFGLGLHLTIRPVRRLDPGPLLVALFGLGLVGAAIWPAVDASGAFTEDRLLHVVAGFFAFASAGLAALALAPRFARDPHWSGLSRYVRAVGIVLLPLLVAGGILVRPAGAPLHDWIGLFQWVFLAIWFPCVIVLAVRLMRVLGDDERRPQPATNDSKSRRGSGPSPVGNDGSVAK